MSDSTRKSLVIRAIFQKCIHSKEHWEARFLFTMIYLDKSFQRIEWPEQLGHQQ
jgi:hypothetical protein